MLHAVLDFFFLLSGTKHFEVSRKNQLLKLEPLDFDNQIENISLRMSCEVKNQENEDLNVVKKLIKVTVVDRNDNAVYVDEDSRNVKLFREELEFDEVRFAFHLFFERKKYFTNLGRATS